MTDHQPSQETSEAPESGRRSLWFWVLVGLGVLVLLPMLLLVLILLALKSETGTAWVIDQVPGLQVTDGRGEPGPPFPWARIGPRALRWCARERGREWSEAWQVRGRRFAALRAPRGNPAPGPVRPAVTA